MVLHLVPGFSFAIRTFRGQILLLNLGIILPWWSRILAVKSVWIIKTTIYCPLSQWIIYCDCHHDYPFIVYILVCKPFWSNHYLSCWYPFVMDRIWVLKIWPLIVSMAESSFSLLDGHLEGIPHVLNPIMIHNMGIWYGDMRSLEGKPLSYQYMYPISPCYIPMIFPHRMIGWGPSRARVQLPNISGEKTIVYGKYTELANGIYKPTNITWGHHPCPVWCIVWVYGIFMYIPPNYWGTQWLWPIQGTYGTNWGVRHAAHPSWYRLALWCFHIFWSPNCVVETSMCMLVISFQTAQDIAFSQVNASCLSPVPFFLFPIRNLFLSAQNIVFSQVKCDLCASRPIFFLFPNSQLIPNCKKTLCFLGKCCMCILSHFFLFPNSRLIRLTWPCQWVMSFVTCCFFLRENYFLS